MKESLYPILNEFVPITLEETDSVRLMNRRDIKYTLSFDKILPVLSALKNNYRILEINNKRVFKYRTTYLDTKDFDMYLKHHNNKLNRYKIRFREYIDNNEKFLEVKYKTNTDRTIKDRIKIKKEDFEINQKNEKFIRKRSPYKLADLEQKVQNTFSRITLVNNIDKERITIDFDLHYNNNLLKFDFSNIVIVEVKHEKTSGSDFTRLMHNGYLQPYSFSKYCLGIILFNENIKYNRFKKNLLILNKIENGFQFPHIYAGAHL